MRLRFEASSAKPADHLRAFLAGNSPRLQEARSDEAKKLADSGIWFDF
jgi:hypothetical protein